jgi:hypothetical protein
MADRHLTTINTAGGHQVAWVASGLRRAARDAGVELPVDYARRVASDALARDDQVGVTKLGAGVVIHTAPESQHKLPVLVGYADRDGQWYRDGSRHTPAGLTSDRGAETGVSRSAPAGGVGL